MPIALFTYRIRLPEGPHFGSLARSQLDVVKLHQFDGNPVILCHKHALADTAIQLLPRVGFGELAQASRLHQTVPCVERVHTRVAVRLDALHKDDRLGVCQIDARRQVLLYESPLVGSDTGGVWIRTAVDVDHVESLLTQEGGEQGDGFAHDASKEEKALMVALTDETGAETDVADPKRVEGNHFDIITCGQKRLGCITCK